MPHAEVTTFYYEGDIGDSDCGSVEDRERDTWDDWCDSAFHNGYGGFFPDVAGAYPPVVFSNQWENDIAESSHILPDDGQVPVSTSPILAGTIVPLEFLDSDRTARWDDDGLEVLDRRFSEFSVLPRGTEDKFGDMSVVEGDALGTCASNDEVLDHGEGWLCLLSPPPPRSGNSGNNYVATRLMCHGLAHCRSFAWDPGPGTNACTYAVTVSVWSLCSVW